VIHVYRLIYPLSEHAPPQLWEFEQPYIDNLIRNAGTFDRWVVQWYFENWEALDRENRRIWETYYRPKPLFDHLPTWQDWLPEYRQLIIECRTWLMSTKLRGRGRDPVVLMREAARSYDRVINRIALRVPRSHLSEPDAVWSL